eukprot:scaffold80092_cov33-Tisochrysis_lutea.AAC.1
MRGKRREDHVKNKKRSGNHKPSNCNQDEYQVRRCNSMIDDARRGSTVTQLRQSTVGKIKSKMQAKGALKSEVSAKCLSLLLRQLLDFA